MAYTPTVWANGDVITADKLNKLENGVANEQVGQQAPLVRLLPLLLVALRLVKLVRKQLW